MRAFVISFICAFLIQITLGAPLPHANPLPILNESSTPAEAAEYNLYTVNYAFDKQVPAMNAEIEKILSYLEEIRTKSADDSEQMEKYSNAEAALQDFQSRINRMYHTCGIIDVLLFFPTSVAGHIEATGNTELTMKTKPLLDLMSRSSVLKEIAEAMSKLKTIIDAKDESFVDEYETKYQNLYEERCGGISF